MLREFITWLIKSKNAVFGAAILRLYFVSEISLFFFRVEFVVYSSLLKLWYENLLHLCRNFKLWSGNYRAVTPMKDFLWSSDPVNWISSVYIYIVTVVPSCPRILFPGFLLVPLQILKFEDAQVRYSQPSVSTYAEPVGMEVQLYINKCVWISHWKA